MCRLVAHCFPCLNEIILQSQYLHTDSDPGLQLRLLTRLLAQIEQVLDVNDLHIVFAELAETPRDSLVIGQG
jgi:hypothetical protein